MKAGSWRFQLKKNLKILEDYSDLLKEYLHKPLQALKGRDTLDTGKALTGPTGNTISMPR